MVTACGHDSIEGKAPSVKCLAFLNSNEKASTQWELEKRFMIFENTIFNVH
jgi:adenosine deaminase